MLSFCSNFALFNRFQSLFSPFSLSVTHFAQISSPLTDFAHISLKYSTKREMMLRGIDKISREKGMSKTRKGSTTTNKCLCVNYMNANHPILIQSALSLKSKHRYKLFKFNQFNTTKHANTIFHCVTSIK